MTKKKKSENGNYNVKYVLDVIENRFGLEGKLKKEIMTKSFLMREYLIKKGFDGDDVLTVCVDKNKVIISLSKQGILEYGGVFHYFRQSKEDTYSPGFRNYYEKIKDLNI